MRRIEPTSAFKRDYKRVKATPKHRDCHVKPDLVLIYRKPNNEVLQLVRLGSHAELGL
jgi:mRNA interferase YafQ